MFVSFILTNEIMLGMLRDMQRETRKRSEDVVRKLQKLKVTKQMHASEISYFNDALVMFQMAAYDRLIKSSKAYETRCKEYDKAEDEVS